jgi:hypothetical protein
MSTWRWGRLILCPTCMSCLTGIAVLLGGEINAEAEREAAARRATRRPGQ